MLYKYIENDNIEIIPSYDFQDLGGLEKDLENLLANNLGDLYYEDGQLMPIFQERQGQEEPDLCALDKDGNLIIFELKRGVVQGDTTIQVMRYAQNWSQKKYSELNNLYLKYTSNEISLQKAHADAFGLDAPLKTEDFNKKQKLVVIGSSADISLMNAVTYWKDNNVDIDFIPYRFYKINNETYFEFFAKPFDYHINPKSCKGIIFDTNKSYDCNSIWDMLSRQKVSAYGDVKTCVKSFNKGDYVLYYHVGFGVVGAGVIKTGKIREDKNNDEMYMDVNLIAPCASHSIKSENELKWISPSELKELLDKSFYYAKTAKVPYLSKEEAEKVIAALKDKYHQ